LGVKFVNICQYIYVDKKTPKYFSAKSLFFTKFYRNIFFRVFFKFTALWSKTVFFIFFQNLLYSFAKWTKKMSKNEKPFSNLEQQSIGVQILLILNEKQKKELQFVARDDNTHHKLNN
jgi:hypothetical protein